jgi:hypothetical protein
VDCSRAIHDQILKKVVIPLKIIAVFEPSEKSCWLLKKVVIPLKKKIVCYLAGLFAVALAAADVFG